MNDAKGGLATRNAGTTPLLVAMEISKKFAGGGGDIEVLKGLSLTLGEGETVAVVGASGSGKTTMLHVLGALDRPDGGRVLFRGEDVSGRDDAGLAAYRNRSVGFMFQFHHLLPEFTALENVLLPALIGGRQKEEMADAARRLMGRVGLASRTTHRIGELSGGEQQRVALARALIMEPALLLADEPTGNLDRGSALAVFALLRELSVERRLATVMVTHNLELAGRMDRVYSMQDGRLLPGFPQG